MSAESNGFAALQNQLNTIRNDPSQNGARNAEADDAVPFKKMPVSYLQELCGRKQVPCIYQMRTCEGQSHDAIFVMGVEIEDLSGSGRAKNKKVAKHFAARDVLYRIVENDRYAEWFIPGNSKEEAYAFLRENLTDIDQLPGAFVDNSVIISVPNDSTADPAPEATPIDPNASNAISKLFEMCSQRNWPAPQYDVIEESGMPHDKTFVMKVQLGIHEQLGTSKTKKIAKRIAAEKMLEFLNKGTLEEHDKDLRIEPEEENDEQLINFDNDQNILQDDGIMIDEPPVDEKENMADDANFGMRGFGSNLQAAALASQASPVKEAPKAAVAPPEEVKPPYWPELEQLDTDAAPGESHREFLSRIAQFHKWSVVYTPLTKKSRLGKYQCIVAVGSGKNPCFGAGDTDAEAQCSAALNMLDFLKLGDAQ